MQVVRRPDPLKSEQDLGQASQPYDPLVGPQGLGSAGQKNTVENANYQKERLSMSTARFPLLI